LTIGLKGYITPYETKMRKRCPLSIYPKLQRKKKVISHKVLGLIYLIQIPLRLNLEENHFPDKKQKKIMLQSAPYDVEQLLIKAATDYAIKEFLDD